MTSRKTDHGQMSVMIIGFVMLVGLLLVVVVNASGAYVAHRRLASAADGAASAAAGGVDRRALYQDGLTSDRAPLSSAHARRAATRYLRASGLAVEAVSVRVRNRTVRVRLERTYHDVFSPPGWPSRSRIVAESSAELQLDARTS